MDPLGRAPLTRAPKNLRQSVSLQSNCVMISWFTWLLPSAATLAAVIMFRRDELKLAGGLHQETLTQGPGYQDIYCNWKRD